MERTGNWRECFSDLERSHQLLSIQAWGKRFDDYERVEIVLLNTDVGEFSLYCECLGGSPLGMSRGSSPSLDGLSRLHLPERLIPEPPLLVPFVYAMVTANDDLEGVALFFGAWNRSADSRIHLLLVVDYGHELQLFGMNR